MHTTTIAAGSGIKSQNSVFRGFFSAGIKLPCGFGGNSAGIVSAFYVSILTRFTKEVIVDVTNPFHLHSS